MCGQLHASLMWTWTRHQNRHKTSAIDQEAPQLGYHRQHDCPLQVVGAKEKEYWSSFVIHGSSSPTVNRSGVDHTLPLLVLEWIEAPQDIGSTPLIKKTHNIQWCKLSMLFEYGSTWLWCSALNKWYNTVDWVAVCTPNQVKQWCVLEKYSTWMWMWTRSSNLWVIASTEGRPGLQVQCSWYEIYIYMIYLCIYVYSIYYTQVLWVPFLFWVCVLNKFLLQGISKKEGTIRWWSQGILLLV